MAQHPTPAKIPKIGIYRTSSIGDVILATSCLDALYRTKLALEIRWIGRSPLLDLIHESYPQVKTYELPSQASWAHSRALVKELQDLDVLVDLQRSVGSKRLARALQNRGVEVVAFEKDYRRRLKMLLRARVFGRKRALPAADSLAQPHQYQKMLEAVSRGLRILNKQEALALDLTACAPRLNLSSQKMAVGAKEVMFGSWVGIAPGAAHATKEAPLEVVVKILEELEKIKQERGKSFGLVLLGDHKDRDICAQLADKVGVKNPVLNMAGKLSLLESAKLLQFLKVLLTNDSGLAHIAEAQNVPVAVLFGPTIESFGFAPHLPKSASFSAPLGCRPCSKHGKSKCRYGDKLCFKMIHTKSVAQFLFHKATTEKVSRSEESTGQPSSLWGFPGSSYSGAVEGPLFL